MSQTLFASRHKNLCGEARGGPNLLREVHSRTFSTDPQVLGVLVNAKREPVLWQVNEYQQVILSGRCNWRFINLNTAFRNIGGDPHRTLHVYSNVASSTIVGSDRRLVERSPVQTGRQRFHVFWTAPYPVSSRTQSCPGRHRNCHCRNRWDVSQFGAHPSDLVDPHV